MSNSGTPPDLVEGEIKDGDRGCSRGRTASGAQNILESAKAELIGEQRETRKQIPMPELWL